MRTGVLLFVCLAASGIAAVSCNGPQITYTPDASLAGAADEAAGSPGSGGSDAAGAGSGGTCDIPTNSNSAPVGSCLSAAMFVDCTLNGDAGADAGVSAGVGCLSNGPGAHCTGYPDAACVDKCASNQYAVSCGGLPLDGVTYEAVPDNCKVVANTPTGKAYACCSCGSAN